MSSFTIITVRQASRMLKKKSDFFQFQDSPQFPHSFVTGNLYFCCSRKNQLHKPLLSPTASCFCHLLSSPLHRQLRTRSNCYKQATLGSDTHKVLKRSSMKHKLEKVCHRFKKLPSKITTLKVTPQHTLQSYRLSKKVFPFNHE